MRRFLPMVLVLACAATFSLLPLAAHEVPLPQPEPEPGPDFIPPPPPMLPPPPSNPPPTNPPPAPAEDPLATPPGSRTAPDSGPPPGSGPEPGSELGPEPAPTSDNDELIVEVIGRQTSVVGTAGTSTQGTVGAEELAARPLQRTGELLESVPGVIVTQHSGSGKANQYFLRGFNLDHGTDFLVTVDGAPVNLPTHGHGQGYIDTNFLIPELVESVDYRKGPYFADQGDFSSAGAAHIRTFRKLRQSLVRVEAGRFSYQRAVLARSIDLGTAPTAQPATPSNSNTVLAAVEIRHEDGPWTEPQNFTKLNGFLRFTHGDEQAGYDLALMSYTARWDSTDQIPQRAVDAKQINRFDAIDTTNGGRSTRTGLIFTWHNEVDKAHTAANLYFTDYTLDLFSNFTYFLDDPVNGDQFEQYDRRFSMGGGASHDFTVPMFGCIVTNTFGLQLRTDVIPRVALYHTAARQRIGTVRRDRAVESMAALYWQNRTIFSPWLRGTVGLRGDLFRFQVFSNLPANSGQTGAAMLSPSVGLVFGPWAGTECYLNAGMGYHSNDARGVTINVDPADGVTPVPSVEPLVRTQGAEVGFRATVIEGLQSTLTLWLLDLDSELLFVGDAGLTEPSRASRRTGLEFTNFFAPAPWLAIDADFCLSRTRFTQHDPAGEFIPGSLESMLAAGISLRNFGGFSASLRARYFGPRALIEDNSVRSRETLLFNARIAWASRTSPSLEFAVDVFNLLNTEADDVTYYYDSQLATEGAPVADKHFHPVEPRSVRATLTSRF